MENSLFSDKSEEESEISYDSDPHNVYEDYSPEQGQPSSLEAIDLKAISESQLGSLIEDYHQS